MDNIFSKYSLATNAAQAMVAKVTGIATPPVVVKNNTQSIPRQSAEKGDVVVYDTTNNVLGYVPQAYYTTTDFPTETYPQVGVVVYNHLNGNLTIVGKNKISPDTPDTGVDNVYPAYASSRIGDETGFSLYMSSHTFSDTDGKANTQAVWNLLNQRETEFNRTWDWEHLTSFEHPEDNGMGMGMMLGDDTPHWYFRAFWRYHTLGTQQGEWYLPAIGEYRTFCSDADSVNKILHGLCRLRGVYSDEDIKKSPGMCNNGVFRVLQNATSSTFAADEMMGSIYPKSFYAQLNGYFPNYDFSNVTLVWRDTDMDPNVDQYMQRLLVNPYWKGVINQIN